MKKQSVAKLAIVALIFFGVASILFFRNQKTFETESIPRPKSSAAFHASGSPSKENVSTTYAEEVEQLKRAVEKNPDNAGHVKALARLLMDGHQMKEAIPYFELAVKQEPKDDSLLFDLSVCYFSVNEYDGALSTTEKILLLGRRCSEALYNKGVILTAQGKTGEAGKTWKQLIAAAPNSEEAKKANSHLAQIGMK